jgi:hypothetical protein
LRDATLVDPTFDATNFQGRQASVRSFMGGKDADTVRALNQAILHAGSLIQSADALHNRQFPAWNYIANSAESAMGADAPNNFTLNAHAFAEEMSKAFKGANISDSEVKQWEQTLSPNMSPDQLRGAIGKGLELLHGALQSIEQKRLAGVGPVMAQRMGPLLKAEQEAVLSGADKWVGNRPGVNIGHGSARAPTSPKPGNYVFNPATGQLEPQ